MDRALETELYSLALNRSGVGSLVAKRASQIYPPTNHRHLYVVLGLVTKLMKPNTIHNIKIVLYPCAQKRP